MTVQLVPHSISRELKDNLQLSLPLLAAWLIYALAPFAGTAMVAHLGKDALAASVLVATIWMAGMTFFFGIFHSVSVLVSQQLGAKNETAITEIMGQAFLLCILSWVPVMVLMYSVPFLVHWSAPNPAILHYATEYSHALMWAAPGLLTLAMLEHFLSGIGRTKLSLCISLLEVPFEILMLYLFVFGKGGLPEFGIAGVGYGMAFCYTVTTIVVLIYLNFSRLTRHLQIFKNFGTLDWRYCKEMLSIGGPIGLTYFIELLGFTIATYFISQFSATALAAHQIVMQFDAVLINIPYALSQGVSIRVGQNVGRQDKLGVNYASYVGLGVILTAALFISAILIYFPHWFIAIDLDLNNPNNAELIHEAISLFLILAVYQFFDSVRVAEAGALRGLKDTRFTLFTNIFCFFIFGLCVAYLLGNVLHYGVQGVWLGLTAGMIFGAVVLFIRLRHRVVHADLHKIMLIPE